MPNPSKIIDLYIGPERIIMTCSNEPKDITKNAYGKCHICTHLETIAYCKICCHWFCNRCRSNYFSRGIAAIKEMTGGIKKGCCGPIS